MGNTNVDGRRRLPMLLLYERIELDSLNPKQCLWAEVLMRLAERNQEDASCGSGIKDGTSGRKPHS